MLPLVAAAAIGAGSAFGGGLLSQRSNKKEARRQEELQREFAQHGVRWRVEDAKAAGLHPLYALGAQTPSYSPMVVPDSMGPALAEAGQHVAGAVGARQTAYDKQVAALNLALLGKQLDEADARIAYYNSEAARAWQDSLQKPSFPDANAGGTNSFGIHPEGQAPNVGIGMTEVKPTGSYTHTQGDPGTAAGTTPMMRQYTLPGGVPFDLPGGMTGDPAEAIESVAENDILLAAVVAWNLYKYGPSIRDGVRAIQGVHRSVVEKLQNAVDAMRPGVQYRSRGGF